MIVQGWLEVLGPTTAAALGAMLGISGGKIAAALLALESAGVVLRGKFSGQETETEWCERGLLARIHRLTLGRMRREIEPVSAAECMSFLCAWQHLRADMRLRGRDGVLEVIRQLQGLELPAPAWEQHVLPARVRDYDPADLENLCLAGVVAWGRLRSDVPLSDDGNKAKQTKRRRRRSGPTRSAPMAFLLRADREYFFTEEPPLLEEISTLTPAAREVARFLKRQGASFLDDISAGTGLLKVKVEEALWELVARGIATGDGIAGLRVLLTPENKRLGRRARLRVVSGGKARERLMPVGRWSLWRTGSGGENQGQDKTCEHQARQLLRRYGIVFRELLSRESCAPSWRLLLPIYRRLEARGEIRGGRFVGGFLGEQFALPEAVERLRAERRAADLREPVLIASVDPLNLVGILTPGAKLSSHSNQMIALESGCVAEIGPLGALRSRLQQRALSVEKRR